MDAAVQRGRTYMHIGLVLIGSAALGSAILGLIGSAAPMPVLFRLILILFTMQYAYRGRRWAAWLLGFLTLVGLAVMVAVIANSQPANGVMTYLVLIAAGYLIGFLLVFCTPAALTFRRSAATAQQA